MKLDKPFYKQIRIIKGDSFEDLEKKLNDSLKELYLNENNYAIDYELIVGHYLATIKYNVLVQ